MHGGRWWLLKIPMHCIVLCCSSPQIERVIQVSCCTVRILVRCSTAVYRASLINHGRHPVRRKKKKSLQSNSLRMWLAPASLHCEMQLNSPGAINGLLIQTRPGGGAAPSPTGGGALVALPPAVAFFVLTIGPEAREAARARQKQPRRRRVLKKRLLHEAKSFSNRHAKARAGFFALPSLLCPSASCPAQSQVLHTPYFLPSSTLLAELW